MSHLVHFERNRQVNEFIPSKTSLEPHLLHGHLEIYVKKANKLPIMNLFPKHFSKFHKMLPKETADKMTSDPYVSVSISGCTVARTFVIDGTVDPVWDQHFFVPVAHNAAELHFLVKDDDLFGSKTIGFVPIPVHQLCDEHKIEGVFPILDDKRERLRSVLFSDLMSNPIALMTSTPLELMKRNLEEVFSTLSMLIEYHPVEKMSQYKYGVGAGPEYRGIPGTYFPLRKGGKVTLYQDAHVEDGVLPDFKLDDGMVYQHGKCWSEMFQAISVARKLVYIVGWSVSHEISLVRDSQAPSTNSQLGNLLKTKAQEGVRVLLLLWADPTRNFLGFKNEGTMSTYGEKTRHFFKDSMVRVILCPRSSPKGRSLTRSTESEVIYTHHQKTVIVDCDSGYHGKRKIIAFIGGLDLCGGRYDTPSHPLFKTLQTTHKDDFHNPNYNGQTDGCPREPWHDLHCKIDGPAAYDVLANFEERWNRASKNPVGKLRTALKLKRLRKSPDDPSLRIERIADISDIDEMSSAKYSDMEGWHTQIFRSVDSNSVKRFPEDPKYAKDKVSSMDSDSIRGFPKDPKDATDMNLVCGKNVLIDMSIHTAYVHAIRSAQHFIYIENQYFLGSSYNWDVHKDLGANNLIPIEIALKIASKIRAHERFAAYIVIPMWPEGDPTSITTQRILFWQYNTIQMMYEIIYKALQEVGGDELYEPQDYLNFFCLGNREVKEELDGQESPKPILTKNKRKESTRPVDSPQEKSKKFRRFMIYVHSKGMIVDDEYVIIGSANINQRSLDGTRDTEIAMGAYQPHHTWATKCGHPFGQIYGYRMSLWAEHLGHEDESYKSPESLECVRRVRSLGEENWRRFVVDEVTEMRSHLLKYPLEVDRTGKVKSLPNYETFPDFGGEIKGSFTYVIQENLTI